MGFGEGPGGDRRFSNCAHQFTAAESSPGSLQNTHQFFDFDVLLFAVAAGHSIRDAMGDMITQYLLLDTQQSSPDRRQLGQHIDAIAIVVDHARQTADLPFNAIEPPAACCLGGFLHS